MKARRISISWIAAAALAACCPAENEQASLEFNASPPGYEARTFDPASEDLAEGAYLYVTVRKKQDEIPVFELSSGGSSVFKFSGFEAQAIAAGEGRIEAVDRGGGGCLYAGETLRVKRIARVELEDDLLRGTGQVIGAALTLNAGEIRTLRESWYDDSNRRLSGFGAVRWRLEPGSAVSPAPAMQQAGLIALHARQPGAIKLIGSVMEGGATRDIHTLDITVK